MINRSYLPLIFCGLAGLAWPLSLAAVQLGVLTAKAKVEPVRIPTGGKTQITIMTSDGFQQPIAVASIKIITDTGYFEASNQNTIYGFTDKDGSFKAVWQSNLRTPPGAQTFNVTASKNGYISNYPITATAKVFVGDQSEEEDLMRREEELLQQE